MSEAVPSEDFNASVRLLAQHMASKHSITMGKALECIDMVSRCTSELLVDGFDVSLPKVGTLRVGFDEAKKKKVEFVLYNRLRVAIERDVINPDPKEN